MNPRLTAAVLFAIAAGCADPLMERIHVADDQRSFALGETGRAFRPWGHNYAAQGFERPAERSWDKVEADFAELERMGANVIRVHLQFSQFMDGPDAPNKDALARLTHLLRLAEKHRLYLDLTGLACYRKDQRAAWYDALPDRERWAAQAHFWTAVARTCAQSTAVFCYDLANEPIVAGTRKDGWYTGELGGYEFLQRLSLDQAGRPLDDIAVEWTGLMVDAIRKVDRVALITIGMLPQWGVSQRAVGPKLDFIAVHVYPETGKVPQAIETLQRFDLGKPIVIEETFPLSCGVDEEREFLLRSRGIACGWIGHYPDDSPAALRALKASGKITIPQAAYLKWLELFESLGPDMVGARQK